MYSKSDITSGRPVYETKKAYKYPEKSLKVSNRPFKSKSSKSHDKNLRYQMKVISLNVLTPYKL